MGWGWLWVSPLLTTPWCLAGYEEVIQIPKGSVHIDIRELNLSINYLGEEGWEMLKSQPDSAWPAFSPVISRGPGLVHGHRRAVGFPSSDSCPDSATALCSSASILCSPHSSITLSKPCTPLGTAWGSLAFPLLPACWAGD